jgi:hypothetical protein
LRLASTASPASNQPQQWGTNPPEAAIVATD